MESVYSALLLHKAGKDISEDNIVKILEAAGIEFDKNQVKALVAGLEGKDVDEIIASASAAPVYVAAGGSSAGYGAAEPAVEEEEEEEEEEDEEPAGLGALFG